MTKRTLKKWIDTGREIEFTYQGVDYSITYSDATEDFFIYFCEFYKESVSVKDFDSLWNSTYKGMKFSDIWEAVKYDDIYLY